jgi:CheY-like chemotaxis protein
MSGYVLVGIRIVLVEDHADTRESTSRILELYGAQVTTGANGQEGLAAIRIVRPDVVVADLAMPEMDGYTLIREVRALGPEAGGAVPMIALSAHVSPEERVRTRQAGFVLHLAKPTKPANLVQAILRVVHPGGGSGRR